MRLNYIYRVLLKGINVGILTGKGRAGSGEIWLIGSDYRCEIPIAQSGASRELQNSSSHNIIYTKAMALNEIPYQGLSKIFKNLTR